MTRSELVSVLSEKTGVPKRQVSSVLRAFADETIRVVEAGERVMLSGFGAFYLAKLAPREMFGEGKKSKCHSKIRFHQSRRTHGEVRRADRRREDQDSVGG